LPGGWRRSGLEVVDFEAAVVAQVDAVGAAAQAKAAGGGGEFVAAADLGMTLGDVAGAGLLPGDEPARD